MKTWKKLLIFLATLCLLAGGAFLPKLSAGIMDRDFLNRPGSREMESVVLDLSGERRPLSTAGKIKLLRDCGIIPITEREASMTEEAVNAALETHMEEYIGAGIFEWFEYTDWYAEPYLCIDPDDPDSYGIFWTVTIYSSGEPQQSLMVDIDDETGKIFSIRCERCEVYASDGVWERNYATMEPFMHVYLNQLGLIPPGGNVEPNAAYGELDGEVLCCGFSLLDEEYGEILLEFYVTGTGSFWVHFPE